MSHQFESGVFYQDRAWHGLGRIEQKEMTPSEAFAYAKADWLVTGRPVEVNGKEVPGYQGIVRLDTQETLSIMSASYVPIQNQSLCQLAEAISDDILMDAVVVLKGGRRIAFTARIKDMEAEVLPGDAVYCYLVGMTSHDGYCTFQLLYTPVRVVCANTLAHALSLAEGFGSNGRRIAIRHTANATELIRLLPSALDNSRRRFTMTVEQLKAMAATRCSDLQFRSYIEAVWEQTLKVPVQVNESDDKITTRPRQLEDMRCWDSLWRKFQGEQVGFGIKGVPGTVWCAYNAVTQYVTHEAGRLTDEAADQERRFESLTVGTGAWYLNRAHDAAMAMARV